MAIDPPPPNPDRERLEALIAFSRKRLSRALERQQEAHTHLQDAQEQLAADERALDAWKAENPPAQPDLL